LAERTRVPALWRHRSDYRCRRQDGSPWVGLHPRHCRHCFRAKQDRIRQQKITIFFSDFFRRGSGRRDHLSRARPPGLGLARPPARLESSALAGGWNRIASSAYGAASWPLYRRRCIIRSQDCDRGPECEQHDGARRPVGRDAADTIATRINAGANRGRGVALCRRRRALGNARFGIVPRLASALCGSAPDCGFDINRHARRAPS
jgi:hypothetical protein